MNCNELRDKLQSGEEFAGKQEHLRNCADCMEFAIALEPSDLFVTLGGADIVPPGGLDAFVSDVMNEVRLRETEKSLDNDESHPARIAWWWSAAAAVFILVTSWLAIQPGMRPDAARPATEVPVVEQTMPADQIQPSITRPVIDEYDRPEATIVELPTESADELKIVMIFDESLPQDL